MINVLILQHADGEWIGSMGSWFATKEVTLTTVRVDQGESLPDVLSYDWLLIMGGPMSVYDEDNYPWLIPEKQLIRVAIAEGKTVFGICLGAQLIANAMGSTVRPNLEQEIGWFEVERLDPSICWMPVRFKPLSWHGDILDPPVGAVVIARSEITPCQGFTLGDRVVALQFHLEAQSGTAVEFLAHETCGLPEGNFVQLEAVLLKGDYLKQSQKVMHALLDSLW